MNITKTESYRASDGTLHKNMKDAVDHELVGVINSMITGWGDSEMIEEYEKKALAVMMTSQPYRSRIEALFNLLT